jgi:hypothetical protein
VVVTWVAEAAEGRKFYKYFNLSASGSPDALKFILIP